MSRGFVKEGDQEEIPMVPSRADLPAGITNYVTKVGLDQLLAEKQMLVDERNNLNMANENERRIALNHINAKLQLLNNRITEARVVNLNEQPKNEIRFGASITLRNQDTQRIQTFQIVGVDEADISLGKISFISPLAKVLTKKKAGDKVVLTLAREVRVFEIMNIAYK
jgi:transcription elongation factor GreB